MKLIDQRVGSDRKTVFFYLAQSGWNLLILICCQACANDKPVYDFTIVALPDTQHYSETYPEIFSAQTQWIVDNAHEHNIVFVTHLGDIVDNGDKPEQWQVARAAMAKLDQANIPYGTCLGNHDLMVRRGSAEELTTAGCLTRDLQEECIGQLYREHFGPALYPAKTWYGGASPTGLSNYQLIQAGELSLLFLHLAIDPDQGERQWAQQVLDQHPQAAVHVATHRYLLDLRATKTLPYPLTLLAGGRFETVSRVIDPLHFATSITAEELFEQFIAVNPNIFMVQCGHIDAEYHQTSQNQGGLAVHEVLTDFQELSPNGGDGWLLLLHFDLTRKQVRVRTYSPTLGRFRENGDGFEGSLEAITRAISDYGDILGAFVDMDELEKTVKYWTETEQGRQEYYQLLYAEGKRDSDYTLPLNLPDYAM